MAGVFVNQYVSSPAYQKYKAERNAEMYGPRWREEFQAAVDAVTEGRPVPEGLLCLREDLPTRSGLP